MGPHVSGSREVGRSMSNARHGRDGSASESSNRDRKWLVARVGDLMCALPLEHVLEICRPLPITRLPGLPEPVLGTTVLRGRSVPVVDLAFLLSGEARRARVARDEVSAWGGRFVAIRVEERSVALLVDEVAGVHELGAPEALPPLLSASSEGPVESFAQLDRRLVLVLSSFRLLPEPGTVWRRVAQGDHEPAVEQKGGSG